MSSHTTYDIIFAGGGATACVIAGRLAAADPSLRILLIEAGANTEHLHHHVQPGRFYSNFVLHPDVFTFHVANPSKALGGRSVIVPTGRAVGGGSSVNFVMYTRAAASDYDDWENVGNPGWGSKDLIPLCNKFEEFQVEGFENHGTSGPIKVSDGGHLSRIGQEFMDVAVAYDKERTVTKDTNDFSTCNAYGHWYKYIDAKTGKRSDAAHHYIYTNQRNNKNLVVQDRSRVVRILFDDQKRAVGVEYADDKVARSQGTASVFKAMASRLVVLSAGAFGSPAILERSGIGSKELLQELDIPVLVDLPGVGENYNDHNLVFNGYYASSDADTVDVIFHGNEDEVKVHAEQWVANGQGLMATNGIDGGCKLRPTEKDLKEIGPSFERRWKEFYLKSPDKPVLWGGMLAAYTGTDPNIPRGKYFSTGYYADYPVSTGRTHIKSKSPYGPLNFDPGFLDDEADVHVLRWTYKHMREVARRMKHYRGTIETQHPKFPEGSKATTGKRDGPDPFDAETIAYTDEDNKAIDEYHRMTVETTWHSLGTCAMKPREKNGVVDSDLNVYGVKNLKIADLSIAPSNVGANTYNTALATGEKAALIIARELGVKGV